MGRRLQNGKVMIGMRMIHTIRWKFIIVFFTSVLLSLAIVFFLYVLFHHLLYGYYRPSSLVPEFLYTTPSLGLSSNDSGVDFRSSSWSTPFRWLINRFGSIPVMIFTGVVLFLPIFFLLSRRVIRYLEEITFGIQEIAKGNFSHPIKKRSSDELGIVAENINRMALQLQSSIEEEREAERTKNNLITGVSHDLRTPLTSILGFLEYIENDRYKDEVELRHYVNIAYEKSLSLKQLIDDLFEYTRINNADFPLQFAELNISHFLKQLAEEFVPILTAKGMDYKIMTDDPRLFVFADGDELVRAYENIMSNAIRYGRKGTTITIDIQGANDEVIVSIINDGESIPNQDLPYIFERFYRVEKSRSQQTGGTGLGLAITKSIIERHGGHISARSNAKHTTFETCLPLRKQH